MIIPLPNFLSRIFNARRGTALGLVFLLIFILVVLILAAPVTNAPFRIRATTSLLALKVASDTRIGIDTHEWIAWAAPSASKSDPTHLVVTQRRGADTSEVPKPDKLMVWLRSGDRVILRRLPGDPAYFSLTLPMEAELIIQSDPGNMLIQATPHGGFRTNSSPSLIRRMAIGGQAQPALRLLPSADGAGISERFAVAEIFFSAVTPHGVQPGLLDGTLLFFDKPDSELKLYRGTDLRLGEVDAEIEAVALTKDGIEFSATGSARQAQLFVQTRHVTSRARRVIPTRYDALMADPFMAVGVTVIAATFGVVGLILSAVGAIPRVAHWFSGPRR